MVLGLAGMLAHTPSMLLDTIRVDPKTHMGVSRACVLDILLDRAQRTVHSARP